MLVRLFVDLQRIPAEVAEFFILPKCFPTVLYLLLANNCIGISQLRDAHTKDYESHRYSLQHLAMLP